MLHSSSVSGRSFSAGVVLAVLGWCGIAAADPVVLERLAQVYLPFKFSASGSPIFCLGESAAEQLSYDSKAQVVYVSGNKLLRVLDIADPSNPVDVTTVDVPNEITDVYWCGDYLAATVPADPATLPGSLFIYKAYSRDNPSAGIELIAEVKVGGLPDALSFTPDCSMILVANEGEAGVDENGKFANPEGSITILPLEVVRNGGSAEEIQKAAKTIDFKFMNKDPEKYIEEGVRWVWRGQALEKKAKKETMSKDMEPEQIIISKNGKKAFINLQENNALAVLDLRKMKITSIKTYGTKDFSLPGNEFDAAEDGKVELKSWPLMGFLQPDVIKTFQHKGKNYIATANEGDVKEYGPEDQNLTAEWNEFMTGTEFVGRTEKPLPKSLNKSLKNEAMLGGLKISRVDGLSGKQKKGEPTFDRLFTYGGRSFSIFLQKDMSLIFDSGNDFERVMGKYFNWTYNADDPDGWCTEAPPPMSEFDPFASEVLMDEGMLADLISEAQLDAESFASSPDPESAGLEKPSNALTTKPSDLRDAKSRSRGPEPEAVDIGNLGKRRILISTVEKGGVIFVYDISDPAVPVWQSAIHPGAHGGTWAELYNSKSIIDLDPEGLEFVSEEESPIGEPLLIVSGAESGTVSIYKLTTAAVPDDCSTEEPIFTDDGKVAMVVSTSTNCS